MSVAAEALETLSAYAWPGNLAELHRVLAAARLHAQGPEIRVEDLPRALRSAADETLAVTPAAKLPLDQILEQAERRLIEQALRRARGNKTRAAEMLGIWRQRLIRRMETFGIADTEAKQES